VSATSAWILDLSDGLTVEALADLLRPWLRQRHE
jgi:hypothetical protein